MQGFTATDTGEHKIEVPYFEDARAKTAPYYSTKRSIKDVQKEISAIIDELGGERIRYIEGYFGDKPRRYGYVVKFRYVDNDAEIVTAGLPMRNPTPIKVETVKVQAMCIVRDQLKAALTALVFSPGSYPLMQYVIGEGGRNLGELFVKYRDTLAIPAVNPAVESITVEPEKI